MDAVLIAFLLPIASVVFVAAAGPYSAVRQYMRAYRHRLELHLLRRQRSRW